MINNESYVVIWGWMLNNLKLKWNELLVYATIYSFTNWTDEHCYRWSANYLSERCWLQRRQTMNVLKSLEEKWYIERKERTDNGVKFVDYYTPYVKIAQGGYVNFAHHNDSIDKDSNKQDWNLNPKQKTNTKQGCFLTGKRNFVWNRYCRIFENVVYWQVKNLPFRSSLWTIKSSFRVHGKTTWKMWI